MVIIRFMSPSKFILNKKNTQSKIADNIKKNI